MAVWKIVCTCLNFSAFGDTYRNFKKSFRECYEEFRQDLPSPDESLKMIQKAYKKLKLYCPGIHNYLMSLDGINIKQPPTQDPNYMYVPSLSGNVSLAAKSFHQSLNGTKFNYYDVQDAKLNCNEFSAEDLKKKNIKDLKNNLEHDYVWRSDKIIANFCGYISDEHKKFLSTHFNMYESELKYTKKQDGGHNMLRGIVNQLLASNLNSILSLCNQKYKKGQRVKIVDVGAKFMKMLNVLEHAPNSFDFEYMPVRPKKDVYDVNYYDQNLATYMHKAGQGTLNAKRFIAPFEGTIEEWVNGRDSDEEVVFLMNDVHYYLNGFAPAKFLNNKVFLSGGQFPAVLGTKILLPFDQGYYSHMPKMGKNGKYVTTDIEMFTKGSTRSYKHDFVFVDDVDFEIPYGWYSHISLA